MKNLVYNELLICGYNVDVGVVQIFDKDKEGKRVRKQLEVDFVVDQGNQRCYIQLVYNITSEEKQTQECSSLRNIPDVFKRNLKDYQTEEAKIYAPDVLRKIVSEFS